MIDGLYNLGEHGVLCLLPVQKETVQRSYTHFIEEFNIGHCIFKFNGLVGDLVERWEPEESSEAEWLEPDADKVGIVFSDTFDVGSHCTNDVNTAGLERCCIVRFEGASEINDDVYTTIGKYSCDLWLDLIGPYGPIRIDVWT